MVHRWRCRHCQYTVWSASRQSTVTDVGTHMLSHHRNRISDDELQISWSCPYCETTGRETDRDDGIQAFKRHLFDHVEPLLESGVHVAEDINGSGSVAVLGPLESDGVNNARVHFHSPCDIVVFVTTDPVERLRLLDRTLQSWPAWTVVITTKEEPLAGLTDIDPAVIPLEVVSLQKSLGLRDLGETISSVVAQQEAAAGKLSVEFDILPEIIETFDLQTVFKFLHTLDARLREASALSHYYVDPRAQSESTVNVVGEVFDMRLDATGETFTSRSSTPDS